MGEKKIINTQKAGVTGGPYPQATVCNGIVYISGQGAINPETNQITPGTIEEETKLVIENIQIILEEAGSSLDKLLQVTVFLLDLKEYGRFNELYQSYFPVNPPARTCIQAAKLPFSIRVEIDAIAHV